jgi:hypothetical protein
MDDSRAYRFPGESSDSSSSNGASSSTAPDDGSDSSSSTQPSIARADTSSGDGGDGVVGVDGANGGIGISAGDPDGDGSGLINANTSAGGLLGSTLDGVSVHAVSSDSLVDAHAPGLLDATVGDGTVSGILDGVTGSGLTDTVNGIADGFGGIEVDALSGKNLAEVHAPSIADASVGGGSELGSLLGGLTGVVDDAGGAEGGFGGIEVEAVNGQNLAEAHAPGIADATVGGAELGNLVGGVDLGGIGGDLPVDVGGLTGDLVNLDVGGLDIGQTLDNLAS